MSTFIEVKSLEKNCPVIINLDGVMEIAPLVGGGCALFTSQGTIIKVSDNYEQFKQFAMETVSASDVAKRVAKLSQVEKEPAPIDDIAKTPKSTKVKPDA